jgi:nitrate reductase assembly molybdenum cofactor insertion protein NarJ
MTAPTLEDPRTRDLLDDATQYRLAGLLFEVPGGPWLSECCALGAAVTDPLLCQAVAAAPEQADAAWYHSLFGPGGPVSPREVTYRHGFATGGLIAELESYYAAFGYQPRCGETPDHVAVETGFVAYLQLKQAYARVAGRGEQEAVTEEAAARFIADHLSVLAQPLAESLPQSGLSYLALAAQWLLARTGPPCAGRAESDGGLVSMTADEH